MDDRWEENMLEFGAVNVTGFRLVDVTRKNVQDFFSIWRELSSKEYPGAGKFISVSVNHFPYKLQSGNFVLV